MLTGKLVFQPEIRFTPSGKTLAVFDFIPFDDTIHCVAWEDVAEKIDTLMDKLQPGVSVTVTGYFKTRKFRNRDGEQVSRREYTVQSIQLTEQ